MRYCPNCGSPGPEAAQHCPHCGRPLPRKKTSPVPLFLVGILVLIASGILLGNYLKDQNLMSSRSSAIPSGKIAEVPTQILTSTINNPTQGPPSKTMIPPTKTIVANLQLTPVARYAKISNEIGEVNLRRLPGYINKNDQDDVIVKIPTGATVKLLEGPQKADGLDWWFVEWNEYRGWIAKTTRSGRTIMIFKP